MTVATQNVVPFEAPRARTPEVRADRRPARPVRKPYLASVIRPTNAVLFHAWRP